LVVSDVCWGCASKYEGHFILDAGVLIAKSESRVVVITVLVYDGVRRPVNFLLSVEHVVVESLLTLSWPDVAISSEIILAPVFHHFGSVEAESWVTRIEESGEASFSVCVAVVPEVAFAEGIDCIFPGIIFILNRLLA